VTVEATRRTVTIDELIEANGQRVPPRESSPSSFRVGLVLVVRGNASDEDVAAAQAAMDPVALDVAPGFAEATRQRGVLEVVTSQGTAPDGGPSDGGADAGPADSGPAGDGETDGAAGGDAASGADAVVRDASPAGDVTIDGGGEAEGGGCSAVPGAAPAGRQGPLRALPALLVAHVTLGLGWAFARLTARPR
jgi:hypothetical protein